MSTENAPQGSDTIVGSIENQADPSQRVDIKYLQEDNAFVTAGIQTHFAEKEIFIPAYLVVTDFQLMGAIVSEILEKLSLAREGETTFDYAPRFQVLDKVYTLVDAGEYMKLSVAEPE